MAQAAAAQEVAVLLEALGQVAWPADREVVLRLAEGLGWRVTRASSAGLRFVTSLAVDDPRARALLGDEAAGTSTLESLTVNVSDRDEADAAAVHAAFESVCASVADVLGPEVRRDAWEYPRRAWDLASGGRIVLQDLHDVVILKLLSRDMADLERDEVRLGIDPNRVPGTGHDDLENALRQVRRCGRSEGRGQ
ncbi:DUF6301 family protein [Cellulomonas dongxiuzhuiae]|uniref:DUF6301 family protein n=1 Tax=Cellulomonas dongxiuzhuiae TaxID=2819979 RepID=UPI00211269D5|nr:DUF6301 family protein [Cellulomonas dongxiuzhuiae]